MQLSQFKAPKRAFKYQTIRIEMTLQGDEVAIFTLKRPIKLVTGSQFMYNPDNNGKMPVIAKNVTEIRVVISEADKFGVVIYSADKVIKYPGNMVLDVTMPREHRPSRVWLSEPFIIRAQQYRQQMNKDRFDRVMKEFKQ